VPFTDLDLRHLRALIAVADEGSFIGAADALRLSQAAISQQIAGLERAIGQRVFDRPGGPKPVVLTPAGRMLLTSATAIMGLLESTQTDLQDLAAGTGGRLSIGTYQSVSVQLLPDVVSELRSVAPELTIGLIEHDRNDELVAELLSDAIDVTFLAGPYEHESLDLIPLGTDPFVLLLPANGDLARRHPGRRFPTTALAGIPLVGEHEPQYGAGTINAGLRGMGLRPRYAFRSYDNGAQQGMVRAGVGPAIMPLLATDPTDPGIVIKSLDPPLEPRTIMLATRKGATRAPATETFIRIAKRACRARLARARA
jgi:DNA-binding transcriptional LysR family regulator